MKSLANLTGFLFLLVFSISCSNDFLDENKKSGYTLNDTLFLNSSQVNVVTSIVFPARNNSDFSIFMQPKWMTFKSMHGKITDGNLPLSFTIDKNKISNYYNDNVYASLILDISDIGLISLPVVYTNYGNPQLRSSVTALNFESTSSITFSLTNISTGTLIWNIDSLPDWLTLSASAGHLESGNSVSITASLVAAKITPGQELNATLQIKSNSLNGNVNITVHVTSSPIVVTQDIRINGIVTDAEYNQTSGLIAICTKSPNSLIVYNTVTKTSTTSVLNMTPTCISISEDGHKAAIGYSVATVSYIDLDAAGIIRDITINTIPFDIVFGNDSWCYVTPLADQWITFTNVNLETGQVTPCKNVYRSYEKTIIKKVPGQSFFVATCTALSPNGIDTYRSSSGLLVDTVGHYHTDAGNLWISHDSKRVYTRNKKVYSFPKYDLIYHSGNPSLYGLIETTFEFISAFDECQAINSFFIGCSNQYSSSSELGTIIQYNSTNLNLIKSYHLSQVNANGIVCSCDSRYVFVNKSGSELYVIKNPRPSYKLDYWTMEKIQVDATGK